MKRLLGAVWQGLARSHFSALTNLDQRYLDVHGFQCKLSIKTNVLILNPKIPPLAQELPGPPAMADWMSILRKYHYLLFFYTLQIFPQTSTFVCIPEMQYYNSWILA